MGEGAFGAFSLARLAGEGQGEGSVLAARIFEGSHEGHEDFAEMSQNGVMEYWSYGVMAFSKPSTLILHHSNTPRFYFLRDLRGAYLFPIWLQGPAAVPASVPPRGGATDALPRKTTPESAG